MVSTSGKAHSTGSKKKSVESTLTCLINGQGLIKGQGLNFSKFYQTGRVETCLINGQGGIFSKMMINGQVPSVPYKWAGAHMCLIISTFIVKRRGLLYNGVGFSHCINKTS